MESQIKLKFPKVITLIIISVLSGCNASRYFSTVDQGCFREDVIARALYHSPNCDGNYHYIGDTDEYRHGLDEKIYHDPQQKQREADLELQGIGTGWLLKDIFK